jgi:hypothetical protein
LVGVAVAIFVALLVLAARQAIITILVVISPLAFVAFLLPNTEKYFNRWRDLFTTMLMLFPIFSVLFGGSQLAGALIVQNASSMHMLIFGMFVQIFPVVVTPLLIRFSGKLVGQIAQAASRPAKRLVDAEKSHAQRKHALHKARNTALGANAKRRNIVRRRMYKNYRASKIDEGMAENYNTQAEASWTNSSAYSDIHSRLREARERKEVGELTADVAYENLKNSNGAIKDLDVELRVAKAKLDLSKAKVDANWEELKAGETRSFPVSQVATQALANSIKTDTLQKQVESRRAYSAQHEQQQQFADMLIQNQVKANEAGGIAPHGADSALAAAISTTRKAYADSVAEARQIMKHFNLSGSQRQAHALGHDTMPDPDNPAGPPIPIRGKDSSGNVRIFTPDSIFTREAVIEEQMSIGTVKDALEIVAASGTADMQEFKTTIAEGVAKNGWGAKTGGILAGRIIDEIAQGQVVSDDHIDRYITENIKKGKVSAESLAIADVDAVKRIYDVAMNPSPIGLDQKPISAAEVTAGLQQLKREAEDALTNRNISGRMKANTRTAVEDLFQDL